MVRVDADRDTQTEIKDSRRDYAREKYTYTRVSKDTREGGA